MLAMLALALPVQANFPLTVLEDFEGGGIAGAVSVSNLNSPAAAAASTIVANIIESGSRRLRITDGGFTNGATLTIGSALPSAGHYLVLADIKVVNSVAQPLGSFGMAVRQGGTSTAVISDVNAGYVMNLPDYTTTASTLGYQTVAASLQATSAGDLTLYFSTDPSRANDANITTNDGNFSATHRTNLNSSSTIEVYVDNITLVGPGNYNEERMLWISIGDGMSPLNLTTIENRIQFAADNNFNGVVFLARYRSNAYYVPNRTDSTYSNSEPFASGVNAGNDPLQYVIDSAKQKGLAVFAAFSCFLVTDGSNTYPGHLPSSYRTYFYNSGTPIVQTTTHNGDGLWIDPAYSEVRNYTVRIASDLVRNYDIDGIIFDRVRYPDPNLTTNDLGYNPNALTELGYGTPPAPTNTTYRQQRRDAIGAFLQQAYDQLTAIKPWIIVGATPIAYVDDHSSTYNSVMQHFPTWTKQVVSTKVHSFAALDLITPQYYRQWDTSSPWEAPGANRLLMREAQYGYLPTSTTLDYGLMPGALLNYAPLFYQPDNDTQQAEVLATHICDVRDPASVYRFAQGWGIFSATRTQNVIATIRSYNTGNCGTDVLASAAARPDYLMKSGWDSTPPNNVTTLAATPVFGAVNLTWSAPAAAADGETATKYLVYRSTTASVPIEWDNLVNQDFDITALSFSDAASTGLTFGSNLYYRVIPVDDYNNRATSNVAGPVSTSGEIIVESRLAGNSNTSLVTNLTPAPTMTRTGTWADTSSKSTAAGLSALRSMFNTTVGSTVTFSPAVSNTGRYNIYVTVGGGGNTNNNANAEVTINHALGTTVVPSVPLVYNGGAGNAWLLVASDIKFNAGAAGSANCQIILENLDGNNGTGARFVADAIKLTYTDVPVLVSGFALD